MTKRSKKVSATLRNRRRLVTKTPNEALVKGPGADAEVFREIGNPLEDLQRQFSRYVERLESVETALRTFGERPANEVNPLLSELAELRVRLARADEEFARRDQTIEELTTRNQHLEAQLAAADEHSRSLEVVGEEEQARQDPGSDKQAAYQDLIQALTTAVEEVLPREANVLVVSKGDERLLELNGRQAWHFPHAANGTYLGYYPKDSDAAITYLNASRARGAEYLLLPAQALWWLDYYPGFKSHLETHHSRIWQRDETGIIFALGSGASLGRAGADLGSVYAEIASVIESHQGVLEHRVAILDLDSGLDLANYFGQVTVFFPPSNETKLPYLDRTIDVVISRESPEKVEEARRVASGAVIVVHHESSEIDGAGTSPRITVERVTKLPSHVNDASIVIPVHNDSALTNACLTTLTASLPREFNGEIIVFDDASTDDTRMLLKGWQKRDERIRVLSCRTNVGFVTACNRAAKAATRKYLVFLNNDTEPRAGWLTALLDTFRRFPRAGAVGGKLLQQDGTLQEAGGVIFQDGSAAHFMRGERDLESPLINYVREVDYCSGALLATPRRLFAKLGGFDVRYKPAYYEDVDYCFRVRRSGLRVYYQPASVVMHREGGSGGTDVTQGMKRHFVRNQQTFGARWKKFLQDQPVRPPDGDRTAWHRLAERGGESPASC